MIERLPERDLPLAGVMVLDLSQFLAGPSAALRLADLGATAYKIERPGGDAARSLGLAGMLVDGDSLTFHVANRGKQSIALDLKAPSDLATARDLVARADVLIESFRPGAMARLGMSYEALRQLNPRLIYGRVTGYGDDGPWRDLPGQDLLVQSLSGMTWLGGRGDDPPTPFALSIVDAMAGQQLAQGLLAALFRRERTGQGALVEVSLLETAFDLQAEPLAVFLNDGGQPPRRSMVSAAHPYVAAPYGLYRTKDGWLALAMGDIPRIGELLDLPELAGYVESSAWFDDRDAIKEAIARRVERSTSDELLGVLLPAGIWATEVLSWEQSFAHEAVTGLGMVLTLTRPDGTTVRTTRCPLRIDGRILASDRAAPRLDSHDQLPGSGTRR